MSNHHFRLDKLSQLSKHLEELLFDLHIRPREELLPDLADEIAGTAGEIMLLLAGHGDDETVRVTLEYARRLREAARSFQPKTA
ncbi:MAG TPA: hypothetical protein VD835_13335 [Pyrinomonadaceae bacterium]|nr:hypothetical protein [Pyrinomonadaceae bacterium]